MSWETREHQRLRAYLKKHGAAHSVTLSAKDGEIRTDYHPTEEDAVRAAASLAIAWKIEPPTFWQRLWGREAWPEAVIAEYDRQVSPPPTDTGKDE